jgi:crotonobetainyl-CoA:carnitine CoA-transferase CaiB-like acyl-CoA transferase
LKHTPEPGEHTEEILKNLGYDQSAIAALREKKVV